MLKSIQRLGGLLAAGLIVAACGGSSASPAPGQGGSGAAAGPVDLTFWYWAESDAPGADKWMAD
ncbi:MAG TPA: hypothetical protein VF323_10645, partial [Candidatus Limnocylindrales bacterium]